MIFSFRSALSCSLAAAVFLVLATANSGGYRYGASDQAFYIPAILHRAEPGLFPRDRALIEGQSRLLILDDAAAWLAGTINLSLPTVFFAAFVVTGLLLGASFWRLAIALGLGPWAAAALVLAMSLRHRVMQTGVNTFEGYLHPRVLTFAIGCAAVCATLAGRRMLTAFLLALGFLVHPTTALWFGAWLCVSWIAITIRRRPSGLDVGALALVASIALIALLLAASGDVARTPLERMDDVWIEVLGSKDYLFPAEWPASAWVVHGATLAIVILVHVWRRRRGVTVPRESEVVLGVVALALLFLLSLPLIASRVAIAVQLQTSRALWPVEMLATVMLVWAVSAAGSSNRRQVALAAVLATVTFVRGAYVTWFERPDPALVRIGLPANEWTETMTWIRDHSPQDAHFFVDPGHAWKYGTSFRIGAARDVYLEEVKDVSMALYSKHNAHRVRERIGALMQATPEPEGLRALAERFELDYVVRGPGDVYAWPCDRELWRNRSFQICDLSSAVEPVAGKRSSGASRPSTDR